MMAARAAAAPAGVSWPLSTFVGREAELGELAALLERARLLSVVGFGGAGKTRLALELLAGIKGARVLVAELADRSPATVLDELTATVLGARVSVTPGLELLAGMLSEPPTILMLDNCEHVVDPCCRVAESLLGLAPELRIITTSRRPLRAEAEVVWEIPPLGPDDAVRLFCDRAADQRPSAPLLAEDQTAVDAVCEMLEGQPLAIELAAARTRVLTVAEIAASLGMRRRELGHGRRTAPARQRTIRASLEWSHELLSGTERVLLRRLAVFAGGWTLGSAEAVVAGPDLPRAEVLDTLAALVEQSLVYARASGETTRYGMLEVVREHALEQLRQAGEEAQLKDLHLAHVLKLASEQRRARLDPNVQQRGVQEEPNFAAALEHALIGDPDAAMRLVASLAELWFGTGRFATTSSYLRRALDAVGQTHPLRAEVTAALAFVEYFGGRYEQALRAAQETIAVCQADEDPGAHARALVSRATIVGLADTAEGHALLDTAAPMLDPKRRPQTALDAAWMRTVMFELEDRHTDAARAFADWWSLLANWSTTWWHCRYWFLRSWTSGALGHEQDRRDELLRALQAHEQIGAAGVDGFCHGDLVMADIMVGQYDAARRQIEVTRRIATRTGNKLALDRLQRWVAALAIAEGDYDRARQGIQVPLAHGTSSSTVAYGFCGLTSLDALASVLSGEVEAARANAAVLVDTAQRRLAGNPRYLAEAQLLLGMCSLREGELDHAREHLQSALQTAWPAGLIPLCEDILEQLSQTLARDGSPLAAARLLGGLTASRERDHRHSLISASETQHTIRARLHYELERDQLDSALREGAALSLGEIVAYARRARGARKRPHSGWESLSPTEQRVAIAATDGLTNAQIGSALFMSAHTVKVHLSHIYKKLDVAGRTQLATVTVARRAPPHGH